MDNKLDGVYKALLDCHLANLYSFYFKLFKYEKLAKLNMNRDISATVNNAIGLVNKAIDTGESVYHVVGDLPELSVGFFTKRSIIKQMAEESFKCDALLESIKEDQNVIEKTLELTIHYSDTLHFNSEATHLNTTHSDIAIAFKELNYVLQ